MDRSHKAVLAKIQAFEDAFRKAHDWANHTGQGVLEKDGKTTFEDCVRKKFIHYFLLEPVMGDRASARPAVTTDNLLEVAIPSGGNEVSVSSIGVDDGDGGPTPRTLAPTLNAAASAKRAASKTASAKPPAKKAKAKEPPTDSSTAMSVFDKRATAKADGVAERARHNRVMEKLEHDKVQWTMKREQLAYSTELLKQKRDLLSQGFTPTEIVAAVPDMRALFKPSELLDDDMDMEGI